MNVPRPEMITKDTLFDELRKLGVIVRNVAEVEDPDMGEVCIELHFTYDGSKLRCLRLAFTPLQIQRHHNENLVAETVYFKIREWVDELTRTQTDI